MNPIVFHIVSGDAFFSGTGLLLAGVVLESWAAAKRSKYAIGATRLGMLLGTILMGLSSNPSTILCVVCVLAKFVLQSVWTTSQSSMRRITIIFLVSQIVWQANYLQGRRMDVEKFRHLLVIGDSIAAGMNEPESSKWPRIVAEKTALELVHASRPGATTTDILPLLERTASASNGRTTIVVVEIGGNDVFQGRSVESYRDGLESILETMRNRGFETHYMFELPLPPFHERFAFWQRHLARKYNTQLIPKREFLSVIAAKNSTSDSLHLSTSGHQRMAANLLRYFRVSLGR